MKLYRGNLKPFLYAVFAPEDEPAALRALEFLDGRGYSLYHGLPAAKGDIDKAAAVLLFLSKAALANEGLMAALNAAVAKHKPIVATYLEEMELPPALEVPLGAVQGVFRERYENEQDYFSKLAYAEPLQAMRITPAQQSAFRRAAIGLIAGAAIAVAAAIIMLDPFKKAEAAAIAPSPAPYAKTDAVMEDIFAGYTEEDLAKIDKLWLCGDVRFEDWDEIAHEDVDGERQWYYKGARMERGTISDLSILAKMPNLTEVQLLNQSVTELAPLFGTDIQILEIEDCPAESIEGIERMQNLSVLELGMTKVSDISPLAKLKRKKDVELSFYDNPIRDYTPLEGFTSFRRLHLNTSDSRGRNYADIREVLALLAGKSVSHLELYGNNQNIRIEDIAQINNVYMLDIGNLSWTTLEGLSRLPALIELKLQDMDGISSLNGIEALPLQRLEVNGRRRLTDVSAIYELPSLRCLHFNYPQDAVTLDFSRLSSLTELKMGQMRSVRDLSGVTQLKSLSMLHLCMMPWLDDLSPLEGMTISTLTVSPNLEDAALALKERVSWLTVHIDYTNWTQEQIDEAMTLRPASEEQLMALSDKDLAYVVGYGRVGGSFYDPDAEGWINEEWDDEGRHYLLNGERVESEGTIADMSLIGKMTGLKRLELIRQPIKSIEGVQSLSQLESVRLGDCAVTDISPLFAIPTLKRIELSDCPVTSIQGVQNLFAPCSLSFNDTELSDISPLAECDFTEAYNEGGLQLGLSSVKAEDFSALESVKAFSELNINSVDAALWLPHIQNARVEVLRAGWTRLEDWDLAAIAGLEGLRELQIDGQEKLTDLTPLLGCQTLEKLYVSEDMRAAIASLGTQTDFAIEIW